MPINGKVWARIAIPVNGRYDSGFGKAAFGLKNPESGHVVFRGGVGANAMAVMLGNRTLVSEMCQ